MKTIILALMVMVVFPEITFAAKAGAKKVETSNSQKNLNLSTSVRFTGSPVNGKFQTATDSLAVVEDDKYLNDLLGVRSQFQNRIEMEKSRY